MQARHLAVECSAVSVLEFVSKLVSSLVWPATAVTLALIFRDRVDSLLSRLSRLKGPAGVEIDFGRTVGNLREQVEEIENEIDAGAPAAAEGASENGNRPASRTKPVEQTAIAQAHSALAQAERTAELAPRGAVLEAWLVVEFAIERTLVRLYGDPTPLRRPVDAIRRLVRSEKLDPRLCQVLVEMRRLRNEAVHAADPIQVTPSSARQYVKLAREVIETLATITPTTPPATAASQESLAD